jgi:hypothetical protein
MDNTHTHTHTHTHKFYTIIMKERFGNSHKTGRMLTTREKKEVG